jgi:hypothetical protein
MPDRLRELHRVTHGRGSGDRGLHFQRAVDAKHHLIVAHEATNVGSDREQLATMDTRTRAAMGHKTHAVVAYRGYLLRARDPGLRTDLHRGLHAQAHTSGAKAEGRFGRRDFVSLHEADGYGCPARWRFIKRFCNVRDGNL